MNECKVYNLLDFSIYTLNALCVQKREADKEGHEELETAQRGRLGSLQYCVETVEALPHHTSF